MRRQLPVYVGLAVLFAVSFFIFNWPYGYVVAVQSETNDCFFVFGRAFLLEFFDHPAGPLRYAGRFLGQFYHCQWLGALIVSASVTCFGALFQRVLVKLQGAAPLAQVFLPCGLLLALHASPLYLLHDTIGLSASCGAFLGYLSCRTKSARRAYALVATPVVYLLVGVYAWLFVAWIVAFEWLDVPLQSDLPFKIIYVAFSIAVPLIAWRWVFPIPLGSALVYPIMFDPVFHTGSPDHAYANFTADCLLGVALCGLLLLIPFWRRLFSGMRFAAFWQVKPGRSSRVSLAVAIPVLVILLHLARYDAPLARVVACRRLYKKQQWDALLERAKTNPYGDLRLQFMTNVALCHKGQLLDEMFSYPQPWGTRGLFMNFSGSPGLSPAEDDTEDGMYNSDLLYAMGHANYAFRHAYNCMCLKGRTYETMKRIAQCAMVNGEYAMAAKYLNVLERTLFHREYARRYQAIIADSNAGRKEFGDARRRLPTRDGFGHPVAHFSTLLDARRDNRMALDYLMAWLLLDKRPESLESISRNIGRLRSAGYTSIPTHCREAILLLERGTHAAVDWQGYRCDEATVARVDEFIEEMSLPEDGQEVPEDVRARYGDTYMFYFFLARVADGAQGTVETQGGFGGALPQE